MKKAITGNVESEIGLCSRIEKWLTMVLLCLAGSLIWWLPYFQDVYYVPMQDAFGFSNTQIGMLSGVAGFMAMLTYIPGGWVADRFPSRQLMSIALLISAMGGFIFAQVPSFEVCLVLYGLWGVSAALIFWAAMIKATRNWGGRDEQGKAFGILEGGRNLNDAVSASLFLIVFAWMGSNSEALATNINIISSTIMLMAVLVWFVMKDTATPQSEAPVQLVAFSRVKLQGVMKMPIVWLLSLVVMMTSWGMWGTIYFTPYATVVYELGDVWGGAVGTSKYFVATMAAVIAGVVADRIGIAWSVLVLFIIMTAGFLMLAIVPGSPALLPLFLIIGVAMTLAVYATRGIYYALMEQGGVPLKLTGTAVGLVSVIGYTPDWIAPVVSGFVLDAWPGATGFQILFSLISGLCFLGLAAAIIIYRKYR
ncbi:MAG: MFS transporter [Flavobacteriales bacterium]|nr:MFS transporter [Flavobacteriales bacterium]